MLNYKQIKKDMQGITKNKLSINKYNLEWINFPTEEVDWKKCGKNDVAIALNVLYLKAKTNIFYLCFKTEVKSWKASYFSMIWNGEKQWHYHAVKKLSASLRGITSKHHGDFCCLNCLQCFSTEKKLEFHTKVCM